MILSNEHLTMRTNDNLITRILYQRKEFLFPLEYITYGSKLKKRGGSHPCFPIFGPAPITHPEIPQHGYLRHQKVYVLSAKNPHLLRLLSGIGMTKNYPWLIDCITEFRIQNKTIIITYSFNRINGLKKEAPFNLGLHHYWNNPNGINSNIKDLELPDKFCGTIKDPKQIPWDKTNGPVILDIAGIGKVEMSMESKGENRIVVWSDNPRFLCFEQVIDDPKNFGTKSGLYLKPNKTFKAKFILKFS